MPEPAELDQAKDRAHRALTEIEYDIERLNRLQAELRCEHVRFYAGQLDTPKRGEP